MHVVGQHHPGVDLEGMETSCTHDGRPKRGDLTHQEVTAAVDECDGEEVSAARDTVTAIIRHVSGDGGSSRPIIAPRRWGAEEHPTLQRNVDLKRYL